MIEFKELVGITGYAIESIGVMVIVIGSTLSAFHAYRVQHAEGSEAAYLTFRVSLGRAIILGLEFLIAGDIIRTVVVADTLSNIGILALVILIRTFLSITLHLEVEGRWPWQSAK